MSYNQPGGGPTDQPASNWAPPNLPPQQQGFSQSPPGMSPPPGPGWPGLGPPGTSRASFGSRLVGHLIDELVVFVVFFVAVIATLVIGIPLSKMESNICSTPSGQPYSCDQPTTSTVLLWLLLAIVFIVVLFVATFLIHIRPMYKTGQTIGRRVANTRVVHSADGSLLSPGQAFGRYLFAVYISGQIFYLGYLWMLWDDKGETWHDKVVKSTVINV